jgi:hypothetical protein
LEGRYKKMRGGGIKKVEGGIKNCRGRDKKLEEEG